MNVSLVTIQMGHCLKAHSAFHAEVWSIVTVDTVSMPHEILVQSETFTAFLAMVEFLSSVARRMSD